MGRDLVVMRMGKRNRVIAAAAPGVATHQAAERQPGAWSRPMEGDRLGRVMRAARDEPAARREKRGHQELIEADKAAEDKAGHGHARHRSSLRKAISRSWSNAAKGRRLVSARAIST